MGSAQLTPVQSLLLPVENPRDRLELAQVDTVAAVHRLGQEQDVFLDVGGQVQKVHDLSDACPADVTQACQGGIVGDGALAHQLVQAVCQCQQAGHARHASGRYGGGFMNLACRRAA